MSTIKQVAQLAGVSIGTVSHVIGGNVPVSDQLRRKVMAAIRALDYHPNHIARSLKTTRTRTIGIVVPDMTIPFFSQIIRSAETTARQAGYWVLAVDSEDDAARQQQLLSLLRSQRVEGILLVVASGRGSKTQIQRLQASGVPVVCLDRIPEGIHVDSVCVDDCAAAEMGVTHLVSQGHERIAILTGPLALRNERERLRGYRTALEHAGISYSERLVWESTLHNEDVIRVCKQHLANQKNRPSAIFCTNAVTGLGALRGMAACGLATPRDMAFATFDELTPHDIFRPSITSVVQPAADIATRATQILVSRIEKNAPGKIIESRFAATLKVGESSTRYGAGHGTVKQLRGAAS